MPALSATKLHDVTHSLLRIVAGLLYMQHGAQKLFGVLGGVGPDPGGTVALLSLMGLAGVIELFGGLLIALGLFTRPVAFIASGEMAVAYFMAHFPRAWFPLVNHGELPVLYSFIFLFMAVHGAGGVSLDRVLGRWRPGVAGGAPIENARAV